jgi:hypothetical protein
MPAMGRRLAMAGIGALAITTSLSAGMTSSARPAPPGRPVPLASEFVAGGTVRNFVFDPSGDRVLYIADQEVDERVELYSVPSGGGAVTRLSEGLPGVPRVAFALYEVHP